MQQNQSFHSGKSFGLNIQSKANLMMLIVTMFWGLSYLFMKMGLQSIEEFNLIALRFGIAFILAGLIFYKRMIKINFQTMKSGFLLGSILFMVISFVTFGTKFTTVSNAGFLFSLSVVFVPLLIALLFKKTPETKVIVGVLVATVGIALLTLNKELSLNPGDFFIILGALFYAIYTIVTDKVTKNVDSITLGILQLGVTGLWGLLFSLLFESPHLPNTKESWIAILGLSVLCSACGFIGQVVAQKHTTPTHTALIFSLEPVFAAFFAFLFFGEILTAKAYVGSTLVLLGVLLAKMDFKKSLLKIKLQKNINESKI